jgi:hypothetical protein
MENFSQKFRTILIVAGFQLIKRQTKYLGYFGELKEILVLFHGVFGSRLAVIL